MVFSLFRRRNRPVETVSHTLYQTVCDAARHPALYQDGLVPDTVDGRFESIALHTHLVLRQLSQISAPPEVGQALFDTLFADMDQALREIGISDVVLGKEIKKMAEGFFGRAEAYELGLRGTDEELAGAVRRNLLGTRKDGVSDAAVTSLAQYIRRQVAQLASFAPSDILVGKIEFAAPAIDAPSSLS